MAWIVCNFYVPQTFRSTVNGLGLLFLFKHQKHVQEPEIYTESNTFSPPSKAAVLSALDKNPPASLSRIFFLSLAVRIFSPSVFTIQDWFYDLCTDFDPCFYHLDGVCARMPFIKCLGIRYLQKNYTLMKIINFFPSFQHIEESQMRFASINIYSENINICTKMICHGIKIITKFIIHAHLSNIKVSYKTRCFK